MKCLIICLLFFVGLYECKKFTRCELARELFKHGISKEKLPDWVCLVEAESSRDTSKKGGPNRNGSFDHGLFQINDKYWCTATGAAGKDCIVKCDDLRKDDITKAVQCANKVFRRHGFAAWYGWKNKCKDKPLLNLTSCF